MYLNSQHSLRSAVGLSAFKPLQNLLYGFSLSLENRLSLSTIATLLPVVTLLSLENRLLALLGLCLSVGWCLWHWLQKVQLILGMVTMYARVLSVWEEVSHSFNSDFANCPSNILLAKQIFVLAQVGFNVVSCITFTCYVSVAFPNLSSFVF